jgi:hypothetical protein
MKFKHDGKDFEYSNAMFYGAAIPFCLLFFWLPVKLKRGILVRMAKRVVPC